MGHQQSALHLLAPAGHRPLDHLVGLHEQVVFTRGLKAMELRVRSGIVHVVDDDASFRKAMERRLMQAGYEVSTLSFSPAFVGLLAERKCAGLHPPRQDVIRPSRTLHLLRYSRQSSYRIADGFSKETQICPTRQSHP